MKNVDFISGKSILVTGGTGSFGQEFVRHVLHNRDPARLVVFSRDEHKQYEMRHHFGDDPRLRYFLGDIRDRERLHRAFQGIDIIVHGAALKHIHSAEYNPFEFIKTNILGAENLIDAAIDCGIQRVVALSSDKACRPTNLYGATKLCADKLFISSNSYSGSDGPEFGVVRYGNVAGSRGSVVPMFQNLVNTGRLPITDRRMTRFWITLHQAVNFVIDTIDIMNAGELHIPVLPSVRIVDIAKAIGPSCELVEIGIRPGEKLHEEMIDQYDAAHMHQTTDRIIVQAATSPVFHNNQPSVGEDNEELRYRSDHNHIWLTIEDIRASINNLN